MAGVIFRSDVALEEGTGYKGAVEKPYFKALPYSNINLSERRFGAHIEGFATPHRDSPEDYAALKRSHRTTWHLRAPKDDSANLLLKM